MVIFDNAKNNNGSFKKSYTKDKIDGILDGYLKYWPSSVPKLDLAIISPGENSAKILLLKELTNWVDF